MSQNTRITAAIRDYDDENYYFFSGTDFCKFNTEQGQVAVGWQRTASSWTGVDWPVSGAAWSDPSGKSKDHIFFFSGNHYCRYNHNTNRIDKYGWRKSSTYWNGVDRPVNAVVKKSDSLYYLFSGQKYCMYSGGTEAITQNWKFVSDDWTGVNRQVSGAVWNNDRTKIILFAGDEFCQYDVKNNAIDNHGWRKVSTFWPGV